MKLTAGLLAVILTVEIAAGCGSPTSPAESVPVTSVGSEDSLIANETTFVVRSDAELGAAWSQIYAGRLDRVLPPQIDFNADMLVIVAMGRQPSSGFSVRITGARREGDALIVHVTMSRPGANCASATVITGPIAIARLRRTDGPVRFDITRTVVPCQ